MRQNCGETTPSSEAVTELLLFTLLQLESILNGMLGEWTISLHEVVIFGRQDTGRLSLGKKLIWRKRFKPSIFHFLSLSFPLSSFFHRVCVAHGSLQLPM